MVPHHFPHQAVLRQQRQQPFVSGSPPPCCSSHPDAYEPRGAEDAPGVAALVHHGGAGTSHTAAAAGVVQVVLPLRFDQALWAGRLEALGVAPPVPAGLSRGCGVASAAAAVAGAVREVVVGGAAVGARLAAASLCAAMEEQAEEEQTEKQEGGHDATTLPKGGGDGQDGGKEGCAATRPANVTECASVGQGPHPGYWVPSSGIASACALLIQTLCER